MAFHRGAAEAFRHGAAVDDAGEACPVGAGAYRLEEAVEAFLPEVVEASEQQVPEEHLRCWGASELAAAADP